MMGIYVKYCPMVKREYVPNCASCPIRAKDSLRYTNPVRWAAALAKASDPIKHYDKTPTGKSAFIEEVLAPLLIQAETGYSDAKYVKFGFEEYVILIKQKCCADLVNVTGDDLQNIVLALFAHIRTSHLNEVSKDGLYE